MLIEELGMFPASGDSSYSTGPNPDPSQGNFVRLVRDTSFLRLPKQQANQGPKGNVLVAQNLVFKGTHDFGAGNVMRLFAEINVSKIIIQ